MNELINQDNRPESVLAPVLDASPLVDRWLHVDSIDSTQALALERARTEAAGLAIVADQQTAGRGRMGRSWFSMPGLGLNLSLVIDPGRPEDEWPILTTLAALAAKEAIRVAGKLDCRFKWPNDLFVPVVRRCHRTAPSDDQTTLSIPGFGRKICGILADVSSRSRLVVLGIGINISQSRDDFSDQLRPTATSIFRETGQVIERADLLGALLDALERRLIDWRKNGLVALRKEMLEVMPLVGRSVTVVLEGEGIAKPQVTSGQVLEIGPLGELILDGSGEPGSPERVTVSNGRLQRVDPPLVEER